MQVRTRRWGGCALLMTWLLSAAAPATAQLVPFPQSREIEHRVIDNGERLVVLSPVKMVNNALRLDRSLRVTGQGQGTLFDMASGPDTRDVFEHFLTQLNAQGARVLFQCEGRECGQSSIWANTVYGQSTLYGQDRNQRYLAAVRRTEQDSIQLVSLYIVERSNRRLHAWVEILDVSEDQVPTALRARERAVLGPVVVPWSGDVTVQLALGADVLRELDTLAARYPDAHWVLVGHALADPADRHRAFERAAQASSALLDVLRKRGIPADRMRTMDVGPVVPVNEPGRIGNRVEIILLRTPEASP